MAHRLAVLGGAAALVLGTVSTAYAATGSPPVTQPDVQTMRSGESVTVDVLANDSDPDGDPLAVCRLGDLPPQLAGSTVEHGQLVVAADSGGHAGTFMLTYYACDTSYLAPGTLTVRVLAGIAQLRMDPVHGDPRHGYSAVRLHNTYTQRTWRCHWGPTGGTQHRARLGPGERRVVPVRGRRWSVACSSRTADGSEGVGVTIATAQSANASSGGHAQTRLRSPYAWSMRATGGQYLSGSMPAGKAATSRS